MLVTVADGRSLDVRDFGSSDDPLLVVHHGTPGGPVPLPGWVSTAREHGLRLVMYARPGYSGSTRQAGRCIADAAADVAAIADALGARQFLTWGFSGGGPHALACAALLPERVVAAATLASVGPYDAADLDFLAGMGEGNIEEFGWAVAGADALVQPLRTQVEGMLAGGPADLAEAMAPFLSEVDAREASVFGETLLAEVRDGCAAGVDGWVDDDLAFVRPWGFSLAAIGVPVLLRQGRHDAMVPFEHGRWLAGQIPGVEARLSEEDGHLTLLTRGYDDLHAWLRQRWDAATPAG